MFYNFIVLFALTFWGASAAADCEIQADPCTPATFEDDCPPVEPGQVQRCENGFCCVGLPGGGLIEELSSTTEVPVVPPVAGKTTATPETCVDQLNPKTGVSDCPMRKDLCEDDVYFDVMTRQCPFTCNRCPKTKVRLACVDQPNPRTGVSDCPMRQKQCRDPVYREVMERQCPKTCGFCSGTGTTGPTGSNGSCQDRINPATGISDCSARRAYCTKPEYYSLMRADCPKTCGFC